MRGSALTDLGARTKWVGKFAHEEGAQQGYWFLRGEWVARGRVCVSTYDWEIIMVHELPSIVFGMDLPGEKTFTCEAILPCVHSLLIYYSTARHREGILDSNK